MGSKVQITRENLTEDECFELILKKRNKLKWATTLSFNPYDSEIRISKNRIWKNDKELENKFQKSPLLFQLCEYSKGHFYTWHSDYDTRDPKLKRLKTGIVLLNEDFEGGEFELEHYGICDLRMGDILWFDARLLHQVKPITDGIRYSLAIWLLNK